MGSHWKNMKMSGSIWSDRGVCQAAGKYLVSIQNIVVGKYANWVKRHEDEYCPMTGWVYKQRRKIGIGKYGK